MIFFKSLNNALSINISGYVNELEGANTTPVQCLPLMTLYIFYINRILSKVIGNFIYESFRVEIISTECSWYLSEK